MSVAPKKRRTFRKFTFRGIDLEQLLQLSTNELRDQLTARARRRFKRGVPPKYNRLVRKLRASKRAAAAVGPHEIPAPVKTHLRDMIIMPDMIGSVAAVYNGKHFNIVPIKPEMVGRYLAEFSITYKPVGHGRPGIGATNSSRFIPLA